VPLKADLIDEPAHANVVQMLDALPFEEASFDGCEQNVVSWEGTSHSLFQEIQEHYGFVGGAREEYESYFARDDSPPQMWTFYAADTVKAVAGFSTVAKEHGKLRKLLMGCAANYVWSDPRKRASVGLVGGTALARLYVPSDHLAAASFDQSNAFTSVLTPEWMWPWSCVPPLRAYTVWPMLPAALKRKIGQLDWVYPAYQRLAMGGSHSVAILMSINLACIGRTMLASRRLGDLGIGIDMGSTDLLEDRDLDAQSPICRVCTPTDRKSVV
jgi:hypothetical protein